MNISATLVADAQAAVAMPPGEGAFDDPAVAAQPLRGLDATAGDARANVATAGGRPATRKIVALVGMHLGRFAARASAPLADDRYGVEQRHKTQRAVRVGRAKERGKRKPAALHKEVMLGAGAVAVGRIRAGLRPPFGAGTLAASRLARHQWIRLARPSRSSRTWCRRAPQAAPAGHAAATAQLCWQTSHGMPVRSTNRIPRKTCRSVTGDRPPFGRGGRSGTTGSTTAHSSSLRSSLPIS